MCLGQEHVPEAQLLSPLLQVLDDGWMRGEALQGSVTNLADIDGVGGNTFFFDELLYLFEYQ